MRITVTLDDALFSRALDHAGPDADPADLLSDALRTYVRVLAARRLASQGGMAIFMEGVPRRAESSRTQVSTSPGEGAG